LCSYVPAKNKELALTLTLKKLDKTQKIVYNIYIPLHTRRIFMETTSTTTPRKHITLAERIKDWHGEPYTLTDEDRAWINFPAEGDELIAINTANNSPDDYIPDNEIDWDNLEKYV
jgi:hypothetical protein